MTAALAPPPSVPPAPDAAAWGRAWGTGNPPVDGVADGERWSQRTGVRMTVAEFARLPPDPDRTLHLIDGEVWEYPVTIRSRSHSICEARTARLLGNWLDEHLPGGEVAGGEAAVQFPGRETRVGVFDPATVAA